MELPLVLVSVFLNTYNFLDVTQLGRQEEDGRIQAWIRHHDRYPHSASPATRESVRPVASIGGAQEAAS